MGKAGKSAAALLLVQQMDAESSQRAAWETNASAEEARKTACLEARKCLRVDRQKVSARAAAKLEDKRQAVAWLAPRVCDSLSSTGAVVLVGKRLL
jgi:aminoglycoside phosphotransferase